MTAKIQRAFRLEEKHIERLEKLAEYVHSRLPTLDCNCSVALRFLIERALNEDGLPEWDDPFDSLPEGF